MPGVKDSDSQTATVTTEHTLYETLSGDAAAIYVLAVDTGAMVLADILELRIYTKVRGADTQRIAYLAVYAHVQGEPNKYSVPVVVPYTGTAGSLKATLKQTAGTSRAFPWSLNTL